jgi:phosphatidate cytidylyltransferase
VISAAVIISILVLLFGLDFWLGSPDSLGQPGSVLCLVTLTVGLMAASEVLYFNQQGNANVRHWAVYMGTFLVIGLSFVPNLVPGYPDPCSIGHLGWPLFGMAAATGLAFVSQMIGYRQGDQVIGDVARTTLVVAYIGVLLSFWAPLRSYIDNAWGMVALLSLYIPVKMSDTLAYTTGKMVGRTKLAPQLSPGKTIEGVAGGLAGGCAGALLVFYGLAPAITGAQTAAPWWLVLVFGIVVTAVGIIGDLSESLLKRDGGVKNSSRWLRGLGGVMDIIDSVLAAGPVVYAFWLSGLFDPVT